MNKREQLQQRAESLLAEAQQFYDESFDLAIQAVEKVHQCGERLNQLKAMKKVTRIDGSWQKWLKANWTERSVETARKYMQIAREWDNPKLQDVRENGIPLNSIRQTFDVLKGYLVPNPESGKLEKNEMPDEEKTTEQIIDDARNKTTQQLKEVFEGLLDEFSNFELKAMGYNWDKIKNKIGKSVAVYVSQELGYDPTKEPDKEKVQRDMDRIIYDCLNIKRSA